MSLIGLCGGKVRCNQFLVRFILHCLFWTAKLANAVTRAGVHGQANQPELKAKHALDAAWAKKPREDRLTRAGYRTLGKFKLQLTIRQPFKNSIKILPPWLGKQLGRVITKMVCTNSN